MQGSCKIRYNSIETLAGTSRIPFTRFCYYSFTFEIASHETSGRFSTRASHGSDSVIWCNYPVSMSYKRRLRQ